MIVCFCLILVQVLLCSSQNFSFADDDFKCTLPDITSLDNDLDIDRFRAEFSKISEVKFPGLIGPLNEKLICKIKCIDGNWVGPLCSTSTDGRFQPVLRECIYTNEHPLLVITFKNATIDKKISFPHGSAIIVRCKELGMYKLKGDANISCENGQWVPKFPECVPTSIITNFTGDAPPTIKYSVISGSANVEPSGELFVFPDSTLHLNCITLRGEVEPEWTWTLKQGQHTAAWSHDSQENETHYRLVLNKMTVQQSDMYTCTSGEGQTNSVVIKVVSVSCTQQNVNSKQLISFEEGTRIGQSIHYNCQPGFHLNGSDIVTCMGSGMWSSHPPTCVQTFCPLLDSLNPNLSLVEYNSSYGGRAIFQCSWGYRLLGDPGVECEQNGVWSGEPPSCIPIYCPSPLIPDNGKLLTVSATKDGKFPVGDLMTYACDDGFQVLGELSIVCTENGYWSHPPPFCVLPSEIAKSDIIVWENITLIHADE